MSGYVLVIISIVVIFVLAFITLLVLKRQSKVIVDIDQNSDIIDHEQKLKSILEHHKRELNDINVRITLLLLGFSSEITKHLEIDTPEIRGFTEEMGVLRDEYKTKTWLVENLTGEYNEIVRILTDPPPSKVVPSDTNGNGIDKNSNERVRINQIR